MRTLFTTRRAGLAMVALLGTIIALFATAAPASADPVATCQVRDTAYADSGVSRVSAKLEYCTGGTSYWWHVSGTLYDTAADDRTAYLDLLRNGGEQRTWRVSGNGNSGWFSATYYGPSNSFHLMTRACNTWGCSSKATDWLYP